MNSNSLGKNERLKSRKLITDLFKSGKNFNAFPFRVVYALSNNSSPHGATVVKREELPVQAGFSVSTRNFKKAVDRNRIKRLMREAYRIQKSELYEMVEKRNKKLVFFFIFTGKELPAHDFILNKTSVVIGKLIKIIDESAV